MKKEKKTPIRTAVVGFGLSGRVFHTPFVDRHPDFELHTIVTSGIEAGKVYPSARIIRSFEEMLGDSSIDLVVLATPHPMHYAQAMAALEAGKHVIIEKPVTMSSKDMQKIGDRSMACGKNVFPYHNRRWDGDFMTLQQIIREGRLGEVLDFESHFDRYQPAVSRAEWRYTQAEGGGTMYDLGPHLIDQAICLFGKPQGVWCRLHFQREGSLANDSFDLKLFYQKTTATLQASVFVRETGPRFQVHGTLGSYVKYGLDIQEAALKKGKKPDTAGFGWESRRMFGVLNSVAGKEPLKIKYPTLPGHYMGFYEDVLASLRENKAQKVSVEDAILNLEIIDAAYLSLNQKSVINL